MDKNYYIYIMTNKHHTVFYIGITSRIAHRIYEHKHGLFDGFSKQYNIHKFIYYEIYHDVKNAIQREKQIKKWNRAWKLDLVHSINPDMQDLYHLLF